VKARILPIAAALALPAPALAGEIFGGVFVHDVTTPVTRSGQEGGINLHLGWRGERIGALGAVGGPSPHVFASLNTAGDTNYAGAGISWKIGRTVYVRPGIGMAIHDGPRGATTPPERIDFGTRVLFVPEISAGYQIDPRLSIEASWVHLSHAQIFSRHNPGSDSFGVRLNYRFR
jgi:lipid A 3-O-deacylase